MANKVRYGLCNIHYAFVNPTAETQPAWGSVVAIPGAVNIEVEEDGDETVFYADNGEYVSFGSGKGLSGSIEVADFPDAFLAEALGWRVDSNGGLIEIAGAVKKAFALGFQVEGDESGRRNWIYNMTLSRPGESHGTTTENIGVETATANFKASPVTINNEKVTKYSLPYSTAGATAYNGFFSSVTTPAAVSGTTGATQ